MNVSFDTINITIDELTKIDLGPDLELCFDTIHLKMEGYETYFWLLNEMPIDCNNCNEKTFRTVE